MGQTRLIAPVTDLHVHSFNRHLLSTYYEPGTLLGSEDREVNKITPWGEGGDRKDVQLTLEQCRFDCKGLLIRRYFSIISTAVLHNPWLVKSTDAEKTQIWRTDYKLYAD